MIGRKNDYRDETKWARKEAILQINVSPNPEQPIIINSVVTKYMFHPKLSMKKHKSMRQMKQNRKNFPTENDMDALGNKWINSTWTTDNLMGWSAQFALFHGKFERNIMDLIGIGFGRLAVTEWWEGSKLYRKWNRFFGYRQPVWWRLSRSLRICGHTWPRTRWRVRPTRDTRCGHSTGVRRSVVVATTMGMVLVRPVGWSSGPSTTTRNRWIRCRTMRRSRTRVR